MGAVCSCMHRASGCVLWLTGRVCVRTYVCLQEQFLQTFNDRAMELSGEAEALKGQRNDAHKASVAAKRKLGALERKLQEESSRKEARGISCSVMLWMGRGGVCCALALS